MDINQAIQSVYPEAVDCQQGHIGVPVKGLYDEVADDRYYRIWIYRCSHCQMSLGDVPEEEYPDVA